MALPKLETPKHSCNLPSSNETVHFRPFLVGEQKVLLIAQESEDTTTQVREMVRLIDVCCDGIDAKNLPAVDLEFLFLQLRIKSVGETSDISVECNECSMPNDITVNLESSEVVQPKKIIDNIIKLTDTISLDIEQPSYQIIQNVDTSKGENNPKQVFEIIRNCIVSIIDGDEVHTRDDFTAKELDAFLDTMDLKMLDKIQEFFENIPALEINTSYKCEKCSEQNTLNLKGVGNFFN